METPPPALLLGGRSLVAPFLIRRLAAARKPALIASRRPGTAELPTGLASLQLDLAKPGPWRLQDGAPVLSLLPIWVLAENRALFAAAGRIVATSSTSRFGKADSADPAERLLADKIARAEDSLTAWANASGVPLTILRSTLIYDGQTDQNVTRMARFIAKYGFFPVAAPANGLRQPIHADDVAAAMMAALGAPETAGQSVTIAGGEILTYRAMAERVFAALGKQPRFLALPLGVLEGLYRLLTLTRLFAAKGQGFGAFRRMNEDLVFSATPLPGFEPRPFTPTFVL
jgi:uncharacterized protein YbjT (DUF2867 family)